MTDLSDRRAEASEMSVDCVARIAPLVLAASGALTENHLNRSADIDIERVKRLELNCRILYAIRGRI